MARSKNFLKDIFSTKVAGSASLNDLGSGIESANYVKSRIKEQERFIPYVDFSEASNFARYGSAEKYYNDSFTYISSEYPYDGSSKEKIEWGLSGSYFDRYVFNQVYPRTTGYVNIGQSYGTPSQDSSGYDSSTKNEWIYFKGYNTNSSQNANENPNLVLQFDNLNIYNTASRGLSNLDLDGTNGISVEFWLDKQDFNDSSESRRQVVVDIWNNGSWGSVGGVSSSYGRFRVELSGSSTLLEPNFHIELLSGSSGFSSDYIGNNAPTIIMSGSKLTGSWNHFALTFVNDGSQMTGRLFTNGNLDYTYTGGTSMGEITGSMVGQIGSLVTTVSSSGPARGDGKLSASLDEFRFWKTKRTPIQIGQHWFTQVNGGTNTDVTNDYNAPTKYSYTNPVDLGVYYKFNEGIIDTTSINSADTTVLDYSGRVTNGAWTGYSVGARSTGSAIVESSASLSEFQDPILYSSHPTVSSILTEKAGEGQTYDLNNNSSIFHTLPGWIREEDLENDRKTLLNLTQIIGSYFDTLQLQIESLPRLKDINYVSGSEKTYPFTNRMIDSMGLHPGDIFTEADTLEWLASRDNVRNFSSKLDETRNRIYQNIYNNLVMIFKSKGTEKSFRNLIRCYGVDENLIKLNLYGNNTTSLIRDNFESVTVKKRYVDFYSSDRTNSVVFQQTASSNSNTRGYISSSNEVKYRGNTYETEVFFPKDLEVTDDNYFDASFLTASIFGCHTSGTSGTTWGATDYGNFQVQSLRARTNSKDGYFRLTGTTDFQLSELTSSYIKDIYDGSKWNFAVRVKPQKYPWAAAITGSATGLYDVEFTGYQYILDSLINSFSVSGTVSSTNGSNFLESNKRFYVGAHRTNFTGSVLEKSNTKITSLRAWIDYLNDDVLQAHAKDVGNFGTKSPYKNAYVTETGKDLSDNITSIPQMETLALNWDFELVTSSNASGQFTVDDASSGSSDLISRWGWLGPITKWQHSGLGYDFPVSSTASVDRRYVHSAKQQPPEVLNSSNMIEVRTTDDDTLFTRESRPITYFFAAEKSPYAIITDEIIKTFATVMDFNNLIGEPVNRYRQDYKQIDKLRELYFERMENDTIDFEKFVEYFKWVDNSISQMLVQLFPASADYSKQLRTLVESHVLERNKYWTKFPTIEKVRFPGLDGGGRGTAWDDFGLIKSPFLISSEWKHAHAPISLEQDENCFWWHHRAESDTTNNSSGDVTVDKNRQVLRNVALTGYNWNRYRNPRLEMKRSAFYGGGSSVPKIKNVQFPHTELPFGSATQLKIASSSVEPELDCNDGIVPNKKVVLRSKLATDDLINYSSGKGNIFAPFRLYSSSVDSGYASTMATDFKANVDITNYHDDIYGDEIPVQGPFTEKYVGGWVHRHVPIPNSDCPTSATGCRPEAWNLNLGQGPSSTDLHLVARSAHEARSTILREPLAKRPVNVRNIKQTTGSTIIGNYTYGYDVVQTSGRKLNNRFFVKNEGFLPVIDSSTYISGVVDYALPRYDLTGTNKNIFVERFNAPGGPEVSSRGSMDINAEEYSVYNEMNQRNSIVRNALDSWQTEHCGQFGIDPTGSPGDGTTPAEHTVNALSYDGVIASYHKVNRNPAYTVKNATPNYGLIQIHSATISYCDLVKLDPATPGNLSSYNYIYLKGRSKCDSLVVPTDYYIWFRDWAKFLNPQSPPCGTNTTAIVPPNVNGTTLVVEYLTTPADLAQSIADVINDNISSLSATVIIGPGIYDLAVKVVDNCWPGIDLGYNSFHAPDCITMRANLGQEPGFNTVVTGGCGDKVYDNWFIQHPIPQSDCQYMWIASSMEGNLPAASETEVPGCFQCCYIGHTDYDKWVPYGTSSVRAPQISFPKASSYPVPLITNSGSNDNCLVNFSNMLSYIPKISGSVTPPGIDWQFNYSSFKFGSGISVYDREAINLGANECRSNADWGASIWFKNSTWANNQNIICNLSGAAFANLDWQVYIASSSAPDPGAMRFEMQTGSGGSVPARIQNTAQDWADGEWHLLCVSYDNAAKEMKMSLDGAAGTTFIPAEPPTAPATQLTLGAGLSGSTGCFSVSGCYNLNPNFGSVDECAIWDRYLTTADMLEIYNSGCPMDLREHSSSVDLDAWYRFGDTAEWNSDPADSSEDGGKIYSWMGGAFAVCHNTDGTQIVSNNECQIEMLTVDPSSYKYVIRDDTNAPQSRVAAGWDDLRNVTVSADGKQIQAGPGGVHLVWDKTAAGSVELLENGYFEWTVDQVSTNFIVGLNDDPRAQFGELSGADAYNDMKYSIMFTNYGDLTIREYPNDIKWNSFDYDGSMVGADWKFRITRKNKQIFYQSDSGSSGTKWYTFYKSQIPVSTKLFPDIAFQYLTGAVGVTSSISDVVVNVESVQDTVEPGWAYTMDYWPNPSVFSASTDPSSVLTTAINAHFNNLNGPYQYPSWKQTRTGDHPVARHHKRNNILSVYSDGGYFSRKIADFTGTNAKYLSSFKSKTNTNLTTKCIQANLVEPPVSFKYRPIETTLTHEDSLGRSTTLRHCYGNNLCSFSNNKFIDILGIDINDPQIYDKLRILYGEKNVAVLNNFSYNEIIFPQGVNTGLQKIRARNYYAEVADNSSNGYNRTILDRRTFWRNSSANRYRTVSPINSLGYTDFGAQSVWAIETPPSWSEVLEVSGVLLYSGELNASTQMNYVRYPWQSGAPKVFPMFYTSGTIFEPADTASQMEAPIDSGPGATSASAFPTASQAYVVEATTYPPELNRASFTEEISGKKPWFDSYEEYANDVRVVAKEFSILPEFRVSENMEYYVDQKGGDFRATNNKFLTLDGANITASAATENSSLNETFFRDYSNSDFQKYFGKFSTDKQLNSISLRCNVVKKLLPYNGFYPILRSMQLGSLLSQSVAPNIGGIGWKDGQASGSDTNVQFSGALAVQSLMQPFYAPGIMYNTIKSGIAVDWPTFSGSAIKFPTGSLVIHPGTPAANHEERFYSGDGPNFRIPFESLISFENYIPISSSDGESKIGLLSTEAPVEYSSSTARVINKGDFTRQPYFDWNGELSPLYGLATNNFLAEIPNFFLKNNKLTSFTSVPENKFKSFKSGSTYCMDVTLKMPVTGASRTVMHESYWSTEGGTIPHNEVLSAWSLIGPIASGSSYRGRWFGPSFQYCGNCHTASVPVFVPANNPGPGVISGLLPMTVSNATGPEWSGSLTITNNQYPTKQTITFFPVSASVIDEEPITYPYFVTGSGGSGNDIAASLMTQIYNNFSGTISGTVDADSEGNEFTLEQMFAGTRGNTTITKDGLDDIAVGTSFIGGKDGDLSGIFEIVIPSTTGTSASYYAGPKEVKEWGIFSISSINATSSNPIAESLVNVINYNSGTAVGSFGMSGSSQLVQASILQTVPGFGSTIQLTQQDCTPDYVSVLPPGYTPGVNTLPQNTINILGALPSNQGLSLGGSGIKVGSAVSPGNVFGNNPLSQPSSVGVSVLGGTGQNFSPVPVIAPVCTGSIGWNTASMDPAKAPHVPPYYYGKSIATLKYTADGTEGGPGTLDKILANLEIVHSNPERTSLFNRVSDTTNVPAWLEAMDLDSSINFKTKNRTKQVEYELTKDVKGTNKFVSSLAREPTDSSFDIWSIGTKFETPVLNFVNNVEANTWRTVFSPSKPGMWTGYGDFCSGSQGLWLGINETYKNLSKAEQLTTGSLIEQCGFDLNSKLQRVGEIAKTKTISEAIVAIPYLEIPVTNPKSGLAVNTKETIYDKYFFTLTGLNKETSRRIFEQTKLNVESGEPPTTDLNCDDSADIKKTSISELIEKMDKYVLPPQLNFNIYDDIEPFAMYILEIEHTLDRQDLADIWQGVMPKISTTAEKDFAEVSHKIASWEFFGGKQIPENIKWMVFKAKRKAEVNYFKMVDEIGADNRFKFDFKSDKNATPDYSYNWPYDYFSLVELAQVEIENEFKTKRDSDNKSLEESLVEVPE